MGTLLPAPKRNKALDVEISSSKYQWEYKHSAVSIVHEHGYHDCGCCEQVRLRLPALG